jgi:hypothetical protein
LVASTVWVAVCPLIIDLYGTDTESHARTLIGVAAVPFNLRVVISAEVEIAAPHPEAL